MIGPTLGFYFARRFLFAIGGVFVTVVVMIYMLDLVELMRRAGEGRGATVGRLAYLALLRTPATAEQVLPFGVLFGSLATFINLSRKLELVVARAAGISAWQFVAPALAVALALGLTASLIYNPLSAEMKDRSAAVENEVFGRDGQTGNRNGIWLRQRSIDGEAILRAEALVESEMRLTGVTAFVFDTEQRLLERIEAPSARLMRGVWRFENARIVTPGLEPQTAETYLLATSLSAEEVIGALGPTQSASFWLLPDLIRRLDLAGLDTTRYRLIYQTLLARPLLLMAMVMVAASVSLRFLRSGGVAQMVLGGVAAGFVLYVATEVARDLGAAGVVSAPLAAWTAPCLGALIGSLVLLYREDG